MIRDRGNIKWTAMMLPEHVKLLREYDRSQQKVSKPSFDEQKYEQFDEIVSEAMEQHQMLMFSFYRKGVIERLTGTIHYLDTLKKELRIVDQTGAVHILKLEDIVEIEKAYEERI